MRASSELHFISANASSTTFVEGDNYVIFTNLVVRGGVLNGTYAANPAVHGGNNNEGQFCGAQLQYLAPAPAVTPSVSLQIQSLENGQIKLQWSSGTLMQSGQLPGSWTPMPNAASPYLTPADAAQTFYRVKVQ